MAHINRGPDSGASANQSITGTNPFLGDDAPDSYQPISDYSSSSVSPSWQADQYSRGSAQAAASGQYPGYGGPQQYSGQMAPGGYTPAPGGYPPNLQPQYPSQPQNYPHPAAGGGYQYSPAYPGKNGTNVLAIVALATVIFFALMGIVCGHVALHQLKRSGEQGRGLAIAALILGYGQVLVFLFWVIWVIVWSLSSA